MKYAVLGCLIERRGYGYEVVTRLRERIPTWNLAQSSVYKSLDRLEQEGAIARVHESSVGRQVRVFYAATPSGVDTFADWMARVPHGDPVRNEMLLRLSLAEGQHIDVLQRSLELLEVEYLTELHRVTAGRELPSDPLAEIPWEDVVRWLIDAAAIERIEGELRWIALALRVLRVAGPRGTVLRRELSARLMRETA